MGFFGKLGNALAAPVKATGSLVKGVGGATKSLVTGHPIAGAKKIGAGFKAGNKTMRRGIMGRR